MGGRPPFLAAPPTTSLPDGKSIYICYEILSAIDRDIHFGQSLSPSRPMGGRKAALDDDGNIRIQCDNPISLSALTEWGTPDFSAVPLVDHVEEIIQTAANGGAALPLFTVREFPPDTRGAALTSEGLALVTQDASYVSGDLAYTRSSCEAIIDTRTGARYLCRSGHGAALEDGTWAFLEVFDDCPHLKIFPILKWRCPIPSTGFSLTSRFGSLLRWKSHPVETPVR